MKILCLIVTLALLAGSFSSITPEAKIFRACNGTVIVKVVSQSLVQNPAGGFLIGSDPDGKEFHVLLKHIDDVFLYGPLPEHEGDYTFTSGRVFPNTEVGNVPYPFHVPTKCDPTAVRLTSFEARPAWWVWLLKLFGLK